MWPKYFCKLQFFAIKQKDRMSPGRKKTPCETIISPVCNIYYSEVSVNYNTDCIIASLSETRRDWKFRLMSHRKFSASTSLAETTWLCVVLLWRCKIYGHKFQNEFHAVKIFFIHQLKQYWYCALPNFASWCLECIYLLI